jgi:hypothetical protein
LDEAQLIEQRLAGLGVPNRIVADSELGLENSPGRLRSLEFSPSALLAHQTGRGDSISILWSDIRLLVKGRLRVKKVAVRERKTGRNENEILESSETHADEALVDIYSRQTSVRIAANSFDFSCLDANKSLIAQANFNQLLNSLAERALSADFDDSYDSVRQLLEQVWKSDVHTESRGWRRERPGKLTLGALTQISNEVQFTRYSRLRNHVLQWW